MSCFCLANKARANKDETAQLAHVQEFYKLMLGNYDDELLGVITTQQTRDRLDEFSTVSGSSTLAATDVPLLVAKFRTGGLIRGLAPFVHDALRRKASINCIAQALVVPGHKELTGIIGRDLFIAMALSCSDTVRLYNIAATVPGMPLPLTVPGPSGGSITMWDAFADILCFPRGPLVVSIGTSQSRGMGKTTLLRQLGLCGLARSYDATGGKLATPSIDVYLPVNQKIDAAGIPEPVVADCSAGFTIEDETVNVLLASAAVTLIHIFPRDVSDKAGPSDELKELLTPGRSRLLIVLIRDSESWKPQCRALLDATLDAFKSNIAITIEVQNYMKSVIDRQTIYKSVFNNIQSVWVKCVKGCSTPSLPCLRVGVSGNKPVAELVSPITRELWDLLQQELESDNRISTRIFPFSTASTRHLQLKRDEKRVREDGGVDCESMLTRIAKERGSWNALLAESVPSRLIHWLCTLINTSTKGDSWKLSRLVFEINEAIDKWKQPIIDPLMKQLRDCMDSGEVVKASALHSHIEELNISMDSFWTELEILTSPDSTWEQSSALEADVEIIHQAYAYSILAGAPVQLLKGTPLRLTDTAFLKAILAAGTNSMKSTESTKDQQILVVSVIGAQSSAKSTLLNFLFGCNFVTRAGRCTRGLYASFLKLDDGRLLVVLDTEGLLSLESNPGESGDVFDGQMTLLAMACSQLVLINHKGEVSRQLQDLLEVCMFALKHLRVTNFQPDIFFVLRDQHDRSPTVHEDMLRHMKRHLAGCASRLGLKLEDVLRLNASSIHLLPSAYVSLVQPMTGSELPAINDPVFPDEVLKLRASVMRVLSETVARQSEADTSRMGAWHSLEQWYTHCNSVWETLTQFGHNLLHYKTIREIEVKRELSQIASDVSRHVMENGFKPEASRILQQYIDERLRVSSTDLDAADVELRASLAKSKESWAESLRTSFEAQTSTQERFSATLREEIGGKLPAALDYVYDNLLYTWKLHLKQARDCEQASGMWGHFCEVLDRVLFSDPTKMAIVSESEARQLFAREWTSYEAEFMKRLEAVRKTKSAVAYEVATVCNAALVKAAQERPDYQLLKETGASALLQPGQVLMNDESDDLWRLKYVSPVGRGYENWQADEIGREIRQLRKLVLDVATDVDAEILRAGAMPAETVVIDWLRNCHDAAYKEGKMKVCKVKQPQVLAALQTDIRVVAFSALCREEDNRHKKQVDTLHKQRKEIEEHLLTMAKGNAGDVDRASSFADRFHKQIDQWLDRQVTAFAAEVRATVLSEMPDPAKAHERAFQQSFGARNWMDVIEYCLDVNAYLEKMFLTLFHRRQVAVIATRLPELEQRVRDMYAVLRETVMVWYKETSLAIASGTKRSGSGKRIFDFREFLRSEAAKSVDKDTVIVCIAEIFPATVNFEVRDVRIFSESFREQILARLGSVKDVSGKVLKCLQEQSVQAWSLIRGCTGRCPLCGSKCDCLGEHSKHSCSHHLFPAFHGWMDKATGAPSLSFCKSDEVYGGTYQCRDGEWRSLAEYLPDSHPSWIPFPRGGGGSSDFDEDVTVLRAAWVNCKFALEKYFTPMKASNPSQWECYVEPGRQLTAGDLEAAKRTIRAIRSKTWVPVIPAMKEAVLGSKVEVPMVGQVMGS